MSVITSNRKIVFSGSINEESTAELIAALLSMNCYTDEEVTLIINSGGGHLDDGIGIYDCIRSLPYKTHGIVFGQASSAAVLILQACTMRTIGENSIIMVHAGSVGIDARHPEETFKQVKTSVDMVRRTTKILALACGIDVKLMSRRMRFGSSYVGQKAVDAGFVDNVLKIGDLYRGIKV